MTAQTDEDRNLSWAQHTILCVQQLPPDEATAVRLVYNHHVPNYEAAAWLGLPVAQFNRLLAEALHNLGVALQADDPTR